MNNETPEDRTARYLKRSTFSELCDIFEEYVGGPPLAVDYRVNSKIIQQIVDQCGWTEEEFWKEFHDNP